MIAWTTVEDALRTWVRDGSGLADGVVRWSREPLPRPSPPYITLAIMSVRGIGQDWKTVSDVVDPDPGAEIAITVRGRRELALSLQCFDGARTGASSAAALLERVRTSVRLPSIHAGLRAAGVGVATFGNVVAVDSGQVNGRFEPRAILDVRCFVSSEVAEFATFIQIAEVTRDAPPPTVTFAVDRNA